MKGGFLIYYFLFFLVLTNWPVLNSLKCIWRLSDEGPIEALGSGRLRLKGD